MPYLLDLCYLLLVAILSPWLAYTAIRKGKYRQGWAAKLLGRVPIRQGNRLCLWLHAVSVGEVNLLATLLKEIDRRGLDWECVISTTTATGFELAQKKYPGHTVCYCPLDFSWAVSSALKRLRPDLLVLAELEVWPNLIRAARRRGVPVAVVNGRLSDRSFRGYHRFRMLMNWVFGQLDLVAVQNEQYAKRFVELGAKPESVHITGSLKFDGAQTDRANPQTRRLAQLAGITAEDVIFLAGSTQEPEEQYALDAYRLLSPLHPRLRLILVPRHPERFDAVSTILDRSGISWQRRSRLETHGADPSARALLVDTVGELGAWWGTARIAYVGGSMGSRGGQNMIEPAAYGAAVSFGPKTWNFRDIVSQILAADAAVVVPDRQALIEFVRRCLEEPGFADALGERASELVSFQLGAASRTVDLLSTLLTDGPRRGTLRVDRGHLSRSPEPEQDHKHRSLRRPA